MNAINIIRRSMNERRLAGGERAARAHLRWLLSWASEPEKARELASGRRGPDRPHLLSDGLLAAAEAVEAGLFRARPNRDPRAR